MGAVSEKLKLRQLLVKHIQIKRNQVKGKKLNNSSNIYLK